jgi:hypothetical protein
MNSNEIVDERLRRSPGEETSATWCGYQKHAVLPLAQRPVIVAGPAVVRIITTLQAHPIRNLLNLTSVFDSLVLFIALENVNCQMRCLLPRKAHNDPESRLTPRVNLGVPNGR